MTQFLTMQRKAREMGCGLTRGRLSGRKEGAVPYYLQLRNGRIVPVKNLQEAADMLKREEQDWKWTKTLKNRTFKKAN